ncbi:MAG: STAS domain-containing protein [Candidatus Riflebacteria bacterium]|nr:STAS domain-containing protein [Candidatus Riflebacteria bacterium]
MKIDSRIEDKEKKKFFFLDGEFDIHQTKELRSRIMEELNDGDWSYIMDLRRVFYMDSSGLGMLVYLRKEINRRGGKLVIEGLNESVLNVFRMTRLDDFFELSDRKE